MTYTTETIAKGTWRADRADSLADILNRLESVPAAWEKHACMSHQAGDNGFNATRSFKEAFTLAQTGWREGRDKMVAGLDASRLVNVTTRVKSEEYDVAGAYPMVPTFIAGDPACMVNIGEQELAGTQIIRVVANISFVAHIEPKTIINRGIALLSWVDRLEAQGARVELIALRSTESVSGRGPIKRFSCMFPVKRADEPLEIDRAAFVLAHPDMLRRIMFASMERHGDMQATFSDYGKSSNYEPENWKEAHSIYFDALRSDDENAKYSTLAKACQTVEKIIQEGLTQEEAQANEQPG